MRAIRPLLTVLVVLLALPGAALAKPVEVQLLGLNDFHGHLEATTPGTIGETPTSRRLPPHRRLPGRRRLRRRALPLSGRQRGGRADRPHAVPALCHQALPGRE